jgi:predicted aldo/keto reductase-like oxidoreductase
MQNKQFTRRAFIGSGLAATTAAGTARGGSSAGPNQLEPSKVLNYQPGMKYRRLEKTDTWLSVISLGGLVAVESVYHYAIDQGVNTVHMADGYLGGTAIEVLGKVLKTRRKDVYVAVKDTFDDIDVVLKQLNTDYIDFLMFNRHKAEEVDDPEIPESLEKYQKAGKVRFAGLTSHGDVKAATAAGIESGVFSLVMPVLNQPNLEAMDSDLTNARQKGVGVMAMKTMKGIEDTGLQVAYLKKILQNPAVTTVLKGIGSFEMFDSYLSAAQETLSAEEDRSLYRHAQVRRRMNCMMCDECREACPYGVEISTMLRCKDYYAEQLGDWETAFETYRNIPAGKVGDARCLLCGECEPACPNGIDIVNRTIAVRRLFSKTATSDSRVQG